MQLLPTGPFYSFGAALVATSIIRREQRALLDGRRRVVCSDRALPLDWSDTRPLMASVHRNVNAAWERGPLSCTW